MRLRPGLHTIWAVSVLGASVALLRKQIGFVRLRKSYESSELLPTAAFPTISGIAPNVSLLFHR